MEHDAHLPLRRRGSRSAIRYILGLLLLVNLAASLYQLPLNRTIERRLCREYYAEHDPSAIRPDGSIDEELCKVDDVQKGLGRLQGGMETIWIIGGEYCDMPGRSVERLTPRATGRLRHDDPPQLRGREVRL